LLGGLYLAGGGGFVVVEGGDVGGVLLFDDAALELHAGRELLGLDGPLVGDDAETLDVLEAGEAGVYLVDDLLVVGDDLGVLDEGGTVGVGDAVGDKHKFASVLISPNFVALETWAHAHGVANSNRGALVADPKVIALYQKIVDQVNATLANFEDIKRLRVVPDEWSIETDELTPSMKLKRRVVEKKYAAAIADFYKDEATSTR
jgi:hypothetical protein